MGANRAGDHLPQGPAGSATWAPVFTNSAKLLSGPGWGPESSGESPGCVEFKQNYENIKEKGAR